MRKIVVPGESLGEGKGFLPYIMEENGKIYSTVYGLMSEDDGNKRVIPLQGKYIPEVDDMVVAIVTDVKYSGYTVDFNSPYSGFLAELERGEQLEAGDVVSAVITRVDEVNSTYLEEYRKLSGGTIIEISPVKVPRVIGKQGSMIKMLKDYTGCDLVVGKNGRIWLKGDSLDLIKAAIKKIEKEAHTTGLTDRIKAFLEGKEE